ncbi:MAG TPA: hypothetical protein VH478_07435 [Trebonia sp.]|jgi:hypothetical protein|nr:hypothetical protein [Trebonia sp.]
MTWAEALAQAPRSAGPRRSHALRPVVVAASLDRLRGPVAGLVELPQRLFWSGAERVFDLSDPGRLLEMYEVVFDAARTEADLAEYLNGEMLIRVWPDLAVAPRARRAWEDAHQGLNRAQQLEANPAQRPAGTFAVA